MRYPRFLQNGGTIGFPAPSFGCSIEPYYSLFDAALKRFGEMGYKVCPGPNARSLEGVGISSTPEKCAKELVDMYVSKENDVLIACGGGELMCETISHTDIDALKNADPKWIMGYSDITNINIPLLTLCDVASIYGPCAPTFGERTLHDSITSAFDILCGKTDSVHSYDLHEKYPYNEGSLPDENEPDPLKPMEVTEKSLKSVYDGKTLYAPGEFNGSLSFSGRLIGGCMDCIEVLLGTPYEDISGFIKKYSGDGIIWCLEACDLGVFSIRRTMWHFEQAGWFKKGIIKGFIIGRSRAGEPMFNLDNINAFMPYIEKLGVPAVLDADLGHVSPSMPIVFGSIGHVNVTDNDICLKMEFA